MFAPPRCANSEFAFADDPTERYLDSGIFWAASADPSVIRVRAEHGHTDSDDYVDIRRLHADTTVLRLANGTEYVRLASGSNSISLEVTQGTVLNGPVRLISLIENFRTVPAQIQTLERLHTLWRLRKFRKKDFRPDRRNRRWLLALRALDLDEAQYSHREISNMILNDDDPLVWRREKNSLRARVRRLIALGRDLRDGGYIAILGGTPLLPS